jgi:hypothetical protein
MRRVPLMRAAPCTAHATAVPARFTCRFAVRSLAMTRTMSGAGQRGGHSVSRHLPSPATHRSVAHGLLRSRLESSLLAEGGS